MRGGISHDSLDNLKFQAELAADAAGAFLQGLHTDPGLSVPITPADVPHDPGQSTGNHASADAGMSAGAPHGPDFAAGLSHDHTGIPHDFAGAHDSPVPHGDASAFHH